LGYPTGDVTTLSDKVGQKSSFEHGTVYYSPATGAQALYGPIADRYTGLGAETSYLGYPTGPIQVAPGASGSQMATFQNGYIYYTPGAGAADHAGALAGWSAILGSPY